MIASDTYGAVEGGGLWKLEECVSPLESKAKTNFKTGCSGFNTNFESYLLCPDSGNRSSTDPQAAHLQLCKI